MGLIGNARVEAKGEKGGGIVLVGGDYQGKNPDVPNARATYVGPDAAIDASATESGEGGKVVIWSDQATRVHVEQRARRRAGRQGGSRTYARVSGYPGTDVAGVGGGTGVLSIEHNVTDQP